MLILKHICVLLAGVIILLHHAVWDYFPHLSWPASDAAYNATTTVGAPEGDASVYSEAGRGDIFMGASRVPGALYYVGNPAYVWVGFTGPFVPSRAPIENPNYVSYVRGALGSADPGYIGRTTSWMTQTVPANARGDQTFWALYVDPLRNVAPRMMNMIDFIIWFTKWFVFDLWQIPLYI